MMIHSRKLRIWLYLVLLAVFISACNVKEDKQIKENFNKTLSLYPTKNLDDFYDKEGFRDQEFDKRDKGTWSIRSQMNIQLKGESLKSKGIVLHMNRNTRKATGYFFVSEIKGKTYEKEKKYPVKMENNRIIPTKPLPNDKLKKEIEN
ncbi:TPA: tandem-type lipoprotein, partial [Staphylococcus aureus]|nr:tandem-type lipoprotein [Staphylococcus aureus]